MSLCTTEFYSGGGISFVFQVDSRWLDDRRKQQQLQQQEVGASPTTVISSSSAEGPEDSTENTSIASTSEDFEDEKDLEPEELLRRARSKLLEDLATETNVQKSVLPLPHDLHKYKSVRSCQFLDRCLLANYVCRMVFMSLC